MNITLLIDRELPTDHSFIEGFYLNALEKSKEIRNINIIGIKTESSIIRNSSKKIIYHVIPSNKNKLQKFFFLNKKIKYLTLSTDFFITRNKPVYFILVWLYVRKISNVRHLHQISNLHAETISDGFDNSIKYKLKKLAELLFRKLFLNKADLIIPVSDWMELYLKEKYDIKKSYVLPLGISTNDLIRKHTHRKNFIYVGTVNSVREIQVIIQAFDMLELDAYLTIITSENSESIDYIKLSKLISNLKNKDKFNLYPRMPRKKMLNIVSKHSVGIACFPDKKSMYQLSPIKLMDYLSQGCAVIGTPTNPETNRIISDSGAGIIVNFGVKEISDGLKILYSSNEYLNLYQKNAVNYISNNRNYDSMALEFINYLKGI